MTRHTRRALLVGAALAGAPAAVAGDVAKIGAAGHPFVAACQRHRAAAQTFERMPSDANHRALTAAFENLTRVTPSTPAGAIALADHMLEFLDDWFELIDDGVRQRMRNALAKL